MNKSQDKSRLDPIFFYYGVIATEELSRAAPARYLRAAGTSMDNSHRWISKENTALAFREIRTDP
jgi:hypothetical protein